MNLSDLMQAPWLEATRLARPGSLADASDGAAGSFLSHTFDGPTGSRRYRLYVPPGPAIHPMPLLVMLHGCSQSPEDFALGTRMNLLADRHGFLVAYPGQASHANFSGCWNWFEPGDQRRDSGEPAVLAGITREIIANLGADARRVYVAGMSAGGAMAVILGREYPDLYAAVGVHSGLPYAAACDQSSALTVMWQGVDAASGASPDAVQAPVPTIVFHGDRDYTVNARNGVAVIRQMRESYAARAVPVLPDAEHRQDGQSEGGRSFTRTVHAGPDGRPVLEQWLLHGAGHAWAGGSPEGSNTDSRGPDASAEMVRFFLTHALGESGGH